MHITSLYIYPIKSLGGISLQLANLLKRGLEFDRRWMLVDSDGVFLTQRQIPDLALFSLKMEENQILVYSKLTGSEVRISIIPEGQKECMVKVWGDEVSAVEVSTNVSAWFTNEIGKPTRLVYMPDNSERLIDPNYTHNAEIVSFADGYPVLVTNEASLTELNSRLKQSIEMNRFRPNIVIAGEEPFEEDDWKTVSIGNAQLNLVKKCARCVMVNINPKTAIMEKEVLTALANFRKKDNKVYFGINGYALKSGIVGIGDKIKIGL